MSDLDDEEVEATKKSREKKCEFCQEFTVKKKKGFWYKNNR